MKVYRVNIAVIVLLSFWSNSTIFLNNNFIKVQFRAELGAN